jgi:F-type H+-transporting ATPase subunit delta
MSESAIDVGVQQVARVYAEALLHAAEKHGKGDAILDELDALVHDLFRAQPMLEGFLSSGAIRRNQKESMIRRVFGNDAEPIFLDFLLVLNHHDRLHLLLGVWSCYRELHDERARRMRVKVRSAHALTAEQESKLKADLHDTFQLEPIVDVKIDPTLLGGMIVQMGDWQFDGSVRNRLEQLRNQLLVKSNDQIQSRRDRFSYSG